ncbi:hypothetical protein CEUSTIGMA_g11957.t1 [Chlamydomonas eustigma]|uniref:Uncharacterized protein n=1 Tax=Chlamydomonas eustigma TaxID=1157962 RepID=A0A250XNF0_9CHLO|nr:hypothetical protein CEUSTIGMA_g11957.t1 [Chlamydomonas eustigma]|eukprot:GAX84536.1 hypothetical protein CEUSTIGMA_g11957.t1 [Chlamydomonas eustigma]
MLLPTPATERLGQEAAIRRLEICRLRLRSHSRRGSDAQRSWAPNVRAGRRDGCDIDVGDPLGVAERLLLYVGSISPEAGHESRHGLGVPALSESGQRRRRWKRAGAAGLADGVAGTVGHRGSDGFRNVAYRACHPLPGGRTPRCLKKREHENKNGKWGRRRRLRGRVTGGGAPRHRRGGRESVREVCRQIRAAIVLLLGDVAEHDGDAVREHGLVLLAIQEAQRLVEEQVDVLEDVGVDLRAEKHLRATSHGGAPRVVRPQCERPACVHAGLHRLEQRVLPQFTQAGVAAMDGHHPNEGPEGGRHVHGGRFFVFDHSSFFLL